MLNARLHCASVCLCASVSSWWLFHCIYCMGLIPEPKNKQPQQSSSCSNMDSLYFGNNFFFSFCYVLRCIEKSSLCLFVFIQSVYWEIHLLSPWFIVSTYLFSFSFSFCHSRWFRRRCRMILYRMFDIASVVVSGGFHLFATSNNGKRLSDMKSGKFLHHGKYFGERRWCPFSHCISTVSCCFWILLLLNSVWLILPFLVIPITISYCYCL